MYNYRRNGYESRRQQRTPRMEMAVWQELASDPGHIHPPGHDPSDPYSCTCYPKPSSIGIPSMVYDEIRCPHPEKHHLQPAQDDVFAYPWTVQTYEPPFGFRPSSLVPRPPLSAAKTAPAGVNSRQESPASVNSYPKTAPTKVNVPKLDLKKLDTTNKVPPPVDTTPTLTPTSEALDELKDPRENFPIITQYDSVSQVLRRKYSNYYGTPGHTPLRKNDPDRYRLRHTPIREQALGGYKGMPPRTRQVITRDLPTRNSFYSRYEYSLPPQARLTPGGRSYSATMNPSPTRQFRGKYVDPRTGQQHEYDVRYGKKDLEGDTRLVTA